MGGSVGKHHHPSRAHKQRAEAKPYLLALVRHPLFVVPLLLRHRPGRTTGKTGMALSLLESVTSASTSSRERLGDKREKQELLY